MRRFQLVAVLLMVAAVLCQQSNAYRHGQAAARRLLQQQSQGGQQQRRQQRSRVRSSTLPPSSRLLAAIDKAIKEYDQQQGAAAAAAATFSVVIPVYFHVITDGTNGEVPKATIAAQMKVLNSAFNGTGFRFVLREVTQTDNSKWYSFYDMFSTTELEMKQALRKGGIDALNVYTIWGQDRILSWSYNPAINMTAPGFEQSEEFFRDGVVLNLQYLPDLENTYLLEYTYLVNQSSSSNSSSDINSTDDSANSNSTDPYALDQSYEDEDNRYALESYSMGISLVHEVGHFLGLLDTFDLGGKCLDGAARGDRVADTPAASQSSDTCTPQDSCPGSQGMDSINNYMNVSPDICTYEWTPGQIARMQRVWKVTRGKARRKKAAAVTLPQPVAGGRRRLLSKPH